MPAASTAFNALRRASDQQVMARAMRSTDALRADALRDIGIAFHSAMAALTTGTAADGDVDTLAMSVAVSLLLCEQGLGEEHIETVRIAQDALMTLRARRERHPTMRGWIASAQEMTRLNAAVELLDEQLAHDGCTEGMVARALAEIGRRMRAGEVMQLVEEGA